MLNHYIIHKTLSVLQYWLLFAIVTIGAEYVIDFRMALLKLYQEQHGQSAPPDMVADRMIVVGIIPLASGALAGMIADLNGCGLHEGFAQTCVVLGVDIGSLLYSMVVMSWLMLVSFFFLAGGLLGLAQEGVMMIVRRIWRK